MIFVQNLERQLAQPLIQYSWFDVRKNDETAKKTLLEFLDNFSKCEYDESKSQKNLLLNKPIHPNVYNSLLSNIQWAMEKGLYYRAGNEICTLLRFHPFAKPEIKQRLVTILTTNLKGNGG